MVVVVVVVVIIICILSLQSIITKNNYYSAFCGRLENLPSSLVFECTAKPLTDFLLPIFMLPVPRFELVLQLLKPQKAIDTTMTHTKQPTMNGNVLVMFMSESLTLEPSLNSEVTFDRGRVRFDSKCRINDGDSSACIIFIAFVSNLYPSVTPNERSLRKRTSISREIAG